MADHGEHRLSIYVNKLLERTLLEPCWFTAQDTAARAIGENWEEQAQARMIWAHRQRKYGVKPSQLDWRVFQSPISAEFELKYGKNKLRTGQITTMKLLSDRSIPTGVFWNLRAVYDFLVISNFRLHGNAWNIMRQLEHEHFQADDEAGMKIGAPRKAPAKHKTQPRFLWPS